NGNGQRNLKQSRSRATEQCDELAPDIIGLHLACVTSRSGRHHTLHRTYHVWLATASEQRCRIRAWRIKSESKRCENKLAGAKRRLLEAAHRHYALRRRHVGGIGDHRSARACLSVCRETLPFSHPNFTSRISSRLSSRFAPGVPRPRALPPHEKSIRELELANAGMLDNCLELGRGVLSLSGSQARRRSEWQCGESEWNCSPLANRWSLFAIQPRPRMARRSANFSLTFCRSSGLARATIGKSASRSYGRQASMIARELVELAGSSSGSSGPLQARRTNSISLAGLQRVQMAHITSKRSLGSTSSSTTTTKRPR